MIESVFIQALLEGIQMFFVYNIAWDSSMFVTNKIRFKKISEYDGCIVKDFSFIEDYDIQELKSAINQEKISQLSTIIMKLKNYTSEENLKTVYKNLSTVKIKRNFMMMFETTGSYSSKKNTIKYFLSSALGHEFLHMSSSYYDSKNDISCVGFKQQKGVSLIGKGLNEGYTELLASRIYNKKIR